MVSVFWRKNGGKMKELLPPSSKINNIYCWRRISKKTERGFSKMDIFKNVQNPKTKNTFEKTIYFHHL
jgi:hypothetical protein